MNAADSSTAVLAGAMSKNRLASAANATLFIALLMLYLYKMSSKKSFELYSFNSGNGGDIPYFS